MSDALPPEPPTSPPPAFPLSSEGQDLLRQAGAALGVELSDYMAAFGELRHLLVAGNARMNLTALRSERDIILKHFVDSLCCARGGFLGSRGQVIDLGTGAGFPTLPLAIVYPTLTYVAVDATRKKIDYVAQTAQQLKLSQVTALAARAETLGRSAQHREHYDRVVSRAVAALPILAELGLPLLREGGLLLAQKGPLSAEELDAGQQAAQALGGELFHVEHFELPISHEARSLVVIKKTSPTPALYPRREGVPSKQPLFWKAT